MYRNIAVAYESTSKCWPTISLYFRETKTLSSLQAVSRGRNFQERARYPPAYIARAQYKKWITGANTAFLPP